MHLYQSTFIIECKSIFRNRIRLKGDGLPITYQDSIERLANKKENFVYDNESADHAAIVLSNMLRTTEREFFSFSGKFNGAVSDQENLLYQLHLYVESGKLFNLLLEELPEIGERSAALTMLLEHSEKHDNVRVKVASSRFIQYIENIFDGERLHFSTSDSRAYRLETDTEAFQAVCNFNGPSVAEPLKNIIQNEILN